MNIPKFIFKKGEIYIDKETYNKDVMLVKEYKEDEITQLTNNWRLLEEWLKEGTEELPYIKGDMYWREACENVLDKMKEIKGDDND